MKSIRKLFGCINSWWVSLCTPWFKFDQISATQLQCYPATVTISMRNMWYVAAVKRVIRYLKGTLEYEITYGITDSLVEYTDANWAGDTESRRSLRVYIFLLFGEAVSWTFKRQQLIALLSCEAEYIAQMQAFKEVIWSTRLLFELNIGFELPKAPIIIKADNQGATAAYCALPWIKNSSSDGLFFFYIYSLICFFYFFLCMQHLDSQDHLSLRSPCIIIHLFHYLKAVISSTSALYLSGAGMSELFTLTLIGETCELTSDIWWAFKTFSLWPD